MQTHQEPVQDPVVPDWADLVLEDTWPDRLHPLSRPRNVWKLLQSLFSRRQAVELPQQLAESIPRYILQEFHNLPNGNYSNHLSHGYITGFDIAMLGEVEVSRQWIAERLTKAQTVLDIGTAGGKTAAAVQRQGVPDVWGIDPSPYLLKHAARRNPGLKFVPGIGENLPFGAERFDAITLCFVLHEVPPRYGRQILAECYRCLKPGGLLAIAEPSSLQMQKPRWRSMLTAKGWQHLYFYLLAHFVYEPFVEAWHKVDKAQWLDEGGFELQESDYGMPIGHWLARKR
ncbi:class I SAM-dependent methyltransferase [Pseudomaricurvus sp. HS19]|uniref:class I SAM-dependent methyltransferase n=1 Tax=Pseudomaricurvus sp. HS19 TaxID=2692626 RepID=UPI00136E6DD3|nr:class I SAM-dependent methyltransferase [Pseudomaricurvus sp. HS19]MYM63043.1 methyltransferase domain-containing protein [Pseudomaricurvus sp. HS19]